MIVYGHRSSPLDIAAFLTRFARDLQLASQIPEHDRVVEWMIDFGEAYSGVLDALQPDVDDERPEVGPWSAVAAALASAFCASLAGDQPHVHASIDTARRGVAAIAREPHLARVDVRVSEGFACYALYPEQYVEAAAHVAREFAAAQVCCLGLRTIGATLAHVVSAALTRHGVNSRTRTVRPRGDPFDRRIVWTPALAKAVADSATHVIVVDEGPGLSGSSFAAVVTALSNAGVPGDRILLMPSWDAPTASLRSATARMVWDRHRRIVGTLDHRRTAAGALQADAGALEDLSAGRWRDLVQRRTGAVRPLADTDRPPVQPQHERVKFLDRGSGRIGRFAGLGRYGRSKLARAELFADAGFGPPPHVLSNGVLVLEWCDGAMLDGAGPNATVSTTALIERLADYLAFVRRAFAREGRAATADLREMVRTNAGESLDRDAAAALLRVESADFDEPCCAIDGRLLPYEWIAPGAGGPLIKVDALDHHADDFVAGERDIAWDVAGAITEFRLGGDAADRLLAGYARRSGDADIARRLPLYIAAYTAYRLGYTSLAAETLAGTDDGARFTAARERYRRSLAALAASSPRSAAR